MRPPCPINPLLEYSTRGTIKIILCPTASKLPRILLRRPHQLIILHAATLIQQRRIILIHLLNLALPVDPQQDQDMGVKGLAGGQPTRQLAHHRAVIDDPDDGAAGDDVDGLDAGGEVLDGGQPFGAEEGHAGEALVADVEGVVGPVDGGGELGEEGGRVGVQAGVPAVDEGGCDAAVECFTAGWRWGLAGGWCLGERVPPPLLSVSRWKREVQTVCHVEL